MFSVVVAACQRAPSERAKRFTKFVQRSTFIVPMVQRYGYAIGDKKIRLSVFYKLSIIILLADNQKNKKR